MLIFTHIPKTAGTSLIKNVLRKFVYPKDRDFEVVGKGRTFDDYLFKGCKFFNVPCASGHFPFGIHRCFNVYNEPNWRRPGFDGFSYFTFLREPISRWKSHFLYSLQSDNNDVIKRLYKKMKGELFEDFLQACLGNEVVCNVMTKQLSGMERGYNLFLTDKHEMTGTYYVPSLCHGKYYYTYEDMEEMLSVAKENLEKYYDFIGFQETYNEDVKRFCKYYKIKHPGPGKK